LEVDVLNDQWPMYIKNEVPVESAVTLTWLNIEGAHAKYFNNSTNDTLLPAGSTRLNLIDVHLSEQSQDDYLLLWVDTNFKASRAI
jgi:hypothetical protein